MEGLRVAIANQCKFFGHVITVEKALAIRDAVAAKERNSLVFECMKCGKPVRPHNAGDRCSAHFVHLTRNSLCHFTDLSRDYL